MARTLTQLRSGLRLRLGTSSNLFTNADLDDALNAALQDAAERGEHLNRQVAINLKTEVWLYALPEEIIKFPFRAWHSNVENPCEILSIIGLEERQPRWWEQTGSFVKVVFPYGIGQVGVWPHPNAATGILYVEGVRAPQLLTNDADLAEIPTEYEEALYDYARFWLKLSDDDAEFMGALQHVQRFGDRIGGSPKRQDEPDSLRQWARRKHRDPLRGWV